MAILSKSSIKSLDHLPCDYLSRDGDNLIIVDNAVEDSRSNLGGSSHLKREKRLASTLSFLILTSTRGLPQELSITDRERSISYIGIS